MAAKEQFPFLAEVMTDKVHIRAGQNKSFESLGRLAKGAAVVVVGRSYDWYKIKLPANALSYIRNDYLQMLGDNIGEVVSQRVNVRAGAGVNFTSLGQLSKGTKVRVFETAQGWYKIEPMEGCYGWVAVEFLAFKSQEIPSQAAVRFPHILASILAHKPFFLTAGMNDYFLN